ncbi:pilus assembly protein [Raineyella sp. LH-20]|uniref:pilus assembly protein n=1 Tax=Raineyella sp. LH-20 TaxID=3081204 RepID=UPI002955671F|nr:pilus assembly protein [Raineyella sp. LH-20]WOP18124.1 pilus assembly protein [Raineyella sp. LH-20]
MTTYAAGPGPARPGRRDQRGHALSVMVLLVTVALGLMAGLVVDGGQQVTAMRRATAVAEHAARAAADAAAASALEGGPDPQAAGAAASAVLAAEPEVTGTVTIRPGRRIRVETRAERPTVFLSVIGIGSVHASASASADLVRIG